MNEQNIKKIDMTDAEDVKVAIEKRFPKKAVEKMLKDIRKTVLQIKE